MFLTQQCVLMGPSEQRQVTKTVYLDKKKHICKLNNSHCKLVAHVISNSVICLYILLKHYTKVSSLSKGCRKFLTTEALAAPATAEISPQAAKITGA